MYRSPYPSRRRSQGILIMSKNKRRNTKRNVQVQEKKALDKKEIYGNIGRFVCLVVVTAIVFFTYRLLINQYYFEVTLTVYMVLAAAAILTYVIYNRGFSRRGLTPEMLPDTMTEEEKTEFIEDGVRRLKKSRPLLIVIFAFAFTFVYDVIELIAVPFFKELF